MRAKSILTALVACTILISAQAQDDRVHPYMKAVREQFKLDEGYYLEVDYLREDIMRETSGEGAGKIWMLGDKYRMEVDEYIVYFDGEKQYSQNTQLEEVYVSNPDPESAGYLETVPMSVIRQYEKDFKYQYMGLRTFKGKQRVEIQLYPKNIAGPYSMLKLFIHPQNMTLEGFLLKHKEGINYTMHIIKVEGRQSFDDDSFRFVQENFPNTEIIELIQ